jgi:hypothetical protein
MLLESLVEHSLVLSEKAEPLLKGLEQVEWIDRLDAENDNLRAAIRWSLEADDAQMAARFGCALRMYLVLRARRTEGRLLMEQTLVQGDDLHRHAASVAREELGKRAWTEAYGEGRAMGFEESVAYALGEGAVPPVAP